ncbi:Hypothetical predicted protein [Octopus vulgaris]|uniref:Uncharacterized protein n=1 Tax=Octopus vulgaris TaxID=6645 RepID=A0AA36BF96_OCTVU|nr:Hypothetical predicted protein [Octopus vulgaris]
MFHPEISAGVDMMNKKKTKNKKEFLKSVLQHGRSPASETNQIKEFDWVDNSQISFNVTESHCGNLETNLLGTQRDPLRSGSTIRDRISVCSLVIVLCGLTLTVLYCTLLIIVFSASFRKEAETYFPVSKLNALWLPG